MNLSKSAFRRYKVIDNLLRNKVRRYPTMDEIIEECRVKLDYDTTSETIQKDIANMKMPYPDGFDAPIKFNRRHMGYEYADPDYSLTGVSLRFEELEAIQEAIELVRSIGGSRVSDKFNHAMEKVLSATLEIGNSIEEKQPVLQTMVPPISRGFEHFDFLYRACREKIPISFIHFSYKNRHFKHIILHPFLIKEFNNRWYVIGYSETHNAIRTFGFDRISDPLFLKIKYIRSDAKETKAFLNDVYGVFPIPQANKEEIEIRVSKLETHNFNAYPIHVSQRIEKFPHGESIIKFQLIPSIELAQLFLSKGKQVKILEPQWFIDFTKNLNI